MGLFTHASTGLVPEHARPGRRVRTAETWDRAREDYVAGASAPDVCDRHDLGLSAFRKRASEEGWRRVDQDDPLPPPPEDPDAPPPQPSELSDAAYRAFARAVTAGDVRGARAWASVLRDLRRMLPEAEAEPPQPPPEPHPQTQRHPRTCSEGPRLREADRAELHDDQRLNSSGPAGPALGSRDKLEGDVAVGVSSPELHPVHAVHPISQDESVPPGVSLPLAGEMSAEPTEGAPSAAQAHSVRAVHPSSSDEQPAHAPPVRRRKHFGLARHYVPPPGL